MINIMDFGGTPTGNNTPAINAAAAAIVSSDTRGIYFPRGNWRFDSVPNALTHGVALVGEGVSWTSLWRNYNGDFLRWNGVGGNGGALKNLLINASPGTSTGCGVQLTASASGVSPSVGNNIAISVSGYITSPAGNIRISVNDETQNTGKILFNQSGNSKDSTLSVFRIG